MSSFAEVFLDWAARGVVLSTALALIVGLVLLAWGSRLQARLVYGLTLLPLLPLILPRYTTWDWQLQSESSWTSVAAHTGFVRAESAPSLADGYVAQEVTDEAPRLEAEALALPATSQAIPASDGPKPVFTWPSLLVSLWSVVALALMFGLWRSIRQTENQLASARALHPDVEARLRRLLPRNRRIQFLESDAVASPAAWGVRHQRVVLPLGLADELDDTELAWVLRHELAHHRRGDLSIGVVQRLIQILWWFHPLLWLWQSRIELARECACDEAAARGLRNNPRPAATALLAVASRPSASQSNALALHSLHRNSRLMKTRLTRLLQPQASSFAGYAAVTLSLLLAGATLLLSQSVFAHAKLANPMSPAPLLAQEPEPADEPAPPEEIVEEPIIVEEEIVEVPLEEVELVEEVEPIEEIVEVWETDPGRIVDQKFPANGGPEQLAAQRWLLEQQRPDGSWPTGAELNKPTGEFTHLGTTALVLLALEKRHPGISESSWRRAVQSGMHYLFSKWDPASNRFRVENANVRGLPDHTMATFATLRLRQLDGDLRWKSIHPKAVQTLLEARNPYMGWRYSFQPDGDNDSMMTAMVVRCLGEATKHGIEIDAQALEGARNLWRENTNQETGRVGYQKNGSADPRFYDRADDFPVKYTELCSAMTAVARAASGEDLLESEANLRGLLLIASKPPVWKLTNGSVDYYYWMYGAQAMQEVGGRLAERWHVALREALQAHQTPAGYWPAVDAWSTPGTNVHSTACALIAWNTMPQAQSR